LILYVALGNTLLWLSYAFEKFPSVPLFAINLEAILTLFSWGSTKVSLVILLMLPHPQEDVSGTEDPNAFQK